MSETKVEDLNDSGVVDRLIQRMEDVLKLYTEQFVSLQKTVMNNQLETKSSLNTLTTTMAAFAQANAMQQLQLQQQQLQLQQAQQRVAQQAQQVSQSLLQQQLSQQVFQQQQQQQVCQPQVAPQLPSFPQQQQPSVVPQLPGQLPALKKEVPPPVIQPPVVQKPAQPVLPKPVPQPVAAPAPAKSNGFGDQFKMKEGEWECKTCYVRNAATLSVCACCQSSKDGAPASAAAPAASAFKPTSFVAPTNTTGFTFGTAGATKPAAPVSSAAPTTPSAFSFIPKAAAPVTPSTTSAASTVKPFGSGNVSFKFEPSPVVAKLAPPIKQEGEEEADAPEDFKPDDTQFVRPDIALPDLVEVKTGEEDEDTIFANRAKLYRFFADTKEVKERGAGDVKVLKHKNTGKLRCVMRREQVHKLCANFHCSSLSGLSFKKDRPTTLVFTCLDYSDTDDHPDGESCTFLLRFKTEEDAKDFKSAVEGSSVAPVAAPATSTPSAPKPSPFAAPTSTTATTPSLFGTPKPALPSTPAASPSLFGSAVAAPATTPTNATGFSFLSANKSANSTIASSPAPSAPSIFGGGSPANTSATAPKPSLFGGAAATTGAKPSLFGGSNTVTFASMNTGKPSFLDGKDNSGAFKFDPKASPIFGTKPAAAPAKKEGEEESTDAPEDFRPDDTQFVRPDIALPDLVEVKTGEEDEDTIFANRAKLYRFFADTKEVKERGAGEVKVLKNKTNGKLRCVMRREQVHKLCANFLCSSISGLSFKKDRPTTLVFTCMDYSDTADHPEGEKCTFLLRFKTEDEAKEFKKAVEGN